MTSEPIWARPAGAFLQGSAVIAAAATAAWAAGGLVQAPGAPAAGLGSTSNSKIFVADTAMRVEDRQRRDHRVQGYLDGAPTVAETASCHRSGRNPDRGQGEGGGYGPISPQTPADLTSQYAQLIMWDRHVGPGGMGEDMLNLNVWTPGLSGNRPVMVSFHGSMGDRLGNGLCTTASTWPSSATSWS